mmetsp:Transcript_52037/g.123122  ORF Transcript_52037/g.123122 Transcript_52037/m.123122 type:complete len:407 (-) Transcript_52037:278-1498(-)
MAEDGSLALALHVHGHGFVEPDLKRRVARDLRAVDVVVELVHLHALHVHVPAVDQPARRREARREDRRVPHVLHPAVVGVLHPDLAVARPGVRVARLAPHGDELLKLCADRSELRGVGRRLLERIALREQLVDARALGLVLVFLGTARDARPDDAVDQARERAVRVLGLVDDAGQSQELDAEGLARGILHLRDVRVVRAHANEEEVGRHVDLVVVVRRRLPSVGLLDVVSLQIAVGDDVCVLAAGRDPGGVESLGVHGVDAGHDALEAVLLALRDHGLRLAGRREVEVDALELLVVGSTSRRCLDDDLGTRGDGRGQGERDLALLGVVVVLAGNRGQGVQLAHVRNKVRDRGLDTHGRRAEGLVRRGNPLDGRHFEVVRVEDQRVQGPSRGVQVRLPGHNAHDIAV